MLLGVWDGLQLSAPSGIALVTQNCPVQGHSPSGQPKSSERSIWRNKGLANLAQFGTTLKGPSSSRVPRRDGQGCCWVCITLNFSLHSCFLPLTITVSASQETQPVTGAKTRSTQERITSFGSFSNQSQNAFYTLLLGKTIDPDSLGPGCGVASGTLKLPQ